MLPERSSTQQHLDADSATVELVAEGIPPTVIAARLGISERVVEDRLRRARWAVRKALAKGLLGLGLGAAGLRRWLSSAAAGTAVVAASFVLALLEAVPGESPGRQDSPKLRRLPAVQILPTAPKAQSPAAASAIAARPKPRAGAKAAGLLRRPPEAGVQTPVAGVRLEHREDGRESGGPVEQIQRCIEEFRVELHFLGCGPDS